MALQKSKGPIPLKVVPAVKKVAMLTDIPTYTTLAQIYEAIENEWPDNNNRLIDPQKVREVVSGIVKYFADYQMYKPEIIPIAGQSTVEIDLNVDRAQYYGQIPEVVVFMDDGTGKLAYTGVPWYLDAAPPNTTKITVELGGPSNGIIILK